MVCFSFVKTPTLRCNNNYVRYMPEVLEEALILQRKVEVDQETWNHDSFEEFAADVRRFSTGYQYLTIIGTCKLAVFQYPDACYIQVGAPSRVAIEKTFEVFERHIPMSRVERPELIKTPPPPVTVFIGHGRSQQWRDLKDHLHEQHGYQVEAYEVGARAGHTIRDILETMIANSSFAVLILTGEDEDKDGKLHPRLNVVHELGLFQGSLGFSKAVALLEEGTEEFSNIHGIQQIRYSKGNIRETFGDILATIRREFFDSVA